MPENRIVSSAYYKDMTPSLNSVNNPLIKPLSAAFASILVKTSPTRLDNSGQIGSPCLRPFPIWKKIAIIAI